MTPHDPARPRWQRDLAAFAVLVAGLVLLAAPAGLLWSAIAPRYTVDRKDTGIEFPNIESTKAFVGADGTYVVILLVLGLLTGLLAWRSGARGSARIRGTRRGQRWPCRALRARRGR